MHSARTVFRLDRHIFQSWATNPRIYLAFLMNALVASVISTRLLEFSQYHSEPINVLEPLIISASEANIAVFLPLGFLLLLADAPFVTTRTTYELIRVGKEDWVKAQLIYIFVSGMVFYSFTALVSGLLVASNAYIANIWSKPLYLLTQGDTTAIRLFQLGFEYPEFISRLRPIAAWMQALTLSMLYGVVLGMILFTFNLHGHALGWILAILIHLIGYVGIRSAFLFVIPSKLWLFAYSLPTWLDGKGMFGVLPFAAYILFFVLILLLSALAMLFGKRATFVRRGT